MNNRDIDVLKHIIRYCDEINEAIGIFGDSYEIFSSNNTFKNAAAMCILQIGELTVHLSDDFKLTHIEVPWQDIKDMRNIAAHRYSRLDSEMLWDTIKEDIPALRNYCAQIIK